MPKLLQINITANWGSHGRIAEDIGVLAQEKGWESYIAYGRHANSSQSTLIKIGNMFDEYIHGIQSRLLDNHGLASKKTTLKLVQEIDRIKPDMIHLHNIHGYYLNYPILFQYLAKSNIPVVWTLHDCWPITGHCAYFTYVQCDKWKDGCKNCNHINTYPISYLRQRSALNYKCKKESFTQCKSMTVVPVSRWLADIIDQSFLNKYPIRMIHNGIDLNVFSGRERQTDILAQYKDKHIILGVNSKWDSRKGFKDFIKLRNLLDSRYLIVLVGLPEQQIKGLPEGVIGIRRTNNISELADYYAAATVFVNPTYEDNFPTTNIEAMACGTPVITYQTGGSPESIVEGKTGFVVPYGNVEVLADTIQNLAQSDQLLTMRETCRQHSEKFYNKNQCYQKYFDLYNTLLH